MPGLEQLMKMLGDSRAYLSAAELLEWDIQRKKSERDIKKIAGNWDTKIMLESLKTASHFNFGIALELFLKSLILAEGKNPPKKHTLVKIFNKLSDKPRDKAEELFSETAGKENNSIVAFINMPTPDPSLVSSPPNRKFHTFEDWLGYFDDEMQMEIKRYSHENIPNQRWRHYIENLNPFIEFLKNAIEQVHNEFLQSSSRTDHK